MLFSEKKTNLYFTFSLILLFVTVVLYFVSLDVSGGNLKNFFLYYLFIILLLFVPGNFLVSKFFKLKIINSLIIKFSFIYLFGYSFIFLSYFILNIHDDVVLLYKYLLPLISGIYLIKHFDFKKYCMILKSHKYSLSLLMIISLILIFFSIFGMVLSNPRLEKAGEFSYHQDFFVHIGNIASLSEGFPPKDLRFAGSVYSYHYADAIFHSVIYRLYRIDIFDQIFYFQWVFNIIFLVSALYTFSYLILKNEKDSIIFIFLFIFSSCISSLFAYENGFGLFLNVNFMHLITNINSTTVERGFCLMASALMIQKMREDKNNKYKDILSYFYIGFFVVLCGFIKGPAGGIFIVSICIWNQYIRKDRHEVTLKQKIENIFKYDNNS